MLIAALFFSPFKIPSQSLQLTTPNKVIKSFVYSPPTPQQKPILPTIESVEKQLTQEPLLAKPTPPILEQQQHPNTSAKQIDKSIKPHQTGTGEMQSSLAKDVTPNPIKSTANLPTKKAAAVFNPYKSRTQFAEQLQQQLQADLLAEKSLSRGFSAMQQLPEVVSPSIIKKSELQKRQEATTQVGNETFVKQNGTCTQTTDLSFVDENLGSVTSYSDCGETDDEKYFREFMKKRLDNK